MFVLNQERLMKLHVSSRVMIDMKLFRRSNPNYPKFETQKISIIDIFSNTVERVSVDRIKSNGMDPRSMKERDLVRCSPSVLGYSLNEKIWGEFAVESIQQIRFSPSPFDMLSIPDAKRKVIKSLTESRTNTANDDNENADDIVAGKGQGVIILLHGPPGVGKTLTAETIAEQLRRPLYSISTGQLSTDAGELEFQLSRIFDVATAWKAVLLLDEADVYLQRRNNLQLEQNRIVATFLRKLEYYNGIFFLTTNLLNDFDDAILDRIQLKLLYDDLDASARRNILVHFLKEANADIEGKDLSMFSEIKLNGRQIKNIVKVARNVALSDGV
ncbi:ATP-binding protein [Aspergillus alliaceus]|uniref:ATP-binding protein n=1 Tax=Petromyces alliaceus TaxID=209559 RepID=UPI0012A4C24E|nr:P-loop containing nucleoside triphosphate hydrolase protein [Aspergillus alliaceus]KAB8227883.1 P-loop containing nucleoside triphosphate hydrolase protein [Aspergillus alliaceus]